MVGICWTRHQCCCLFSQTEKHYHHHGVSCLKNQKFFQAFYGIWLSRLCKIDKTISQDYHNPGDFSDRSASVLDLQWSWFAPDLLTLRPAPWGGRTHYLVPGCAEIAYKHGALQQEISTPNSGPQYTLRLLPWEDTKHWSFSEYCQKNGPG